MNIETLFDLDAQSRRFLEFALLAKLNGRILSIAMRVVREDRAATGIDGFNDWLARIEAKDASERFFDDAGFERSPQREELRRWLNVRFALMNAGYRGSSLAETAKFIVAKAAQRAEVTDAEVSELAKHSGLGGHEVRKLLIEQGQRNLGRLMSSIEKAMEVIADLSDPDVRRVDELPGGFAELVLEAVQTAKKQAIRLSRTPQDALATCILLKDLENHV